MADPGSAPAGKKVKANGLDFNVVDEGTGEAVVLLHGFPNNWTLFRQQIPALKEAGYRVIVPDLRGFGDSDKPKAVSEYVMTTLVKDVEGILDALEVSSAHVVGHDWGAALAWAFAGIVKHRTKSLVAISVGHPSGFFAGENGFEQRSLSWYILLFQYPGLADKALLRGARILKPEPLGEHAAREMQETIKLLHSQPETDTQAAAITGGLDWYRANVKPENFLTDALIADLPKVSVNTMGIYPSGDHYLTEEAMKNSSNYVEAPATFRYEKVDCPNHWPTWDAAEATNALILDFIKSSVPGA